MRRRPRIDLGQSVGESERKRLDRKAHNWFERNDTKPKEENPFLKLIKPGQEHYGDPEEKGEEFKKRLSKLEYGNFPGYFNYRNKASTGDESKDEDDRNNNAQEKSKDLMTAETSHPQETKSSTKVDEATKFPSTSNPEDADDRLAHFKKQWFEDKLVLDIGCNRGHITYAIARKFRPKSVVGIDIDLRMINMANKELHLHLEEDVINKRRQLRLEQAAERKLQSCAGKKEDEKESLKDNLDDKNLLPILDYVRYGPLADLESHECESSSTTSEIRFPNNIVFLEHNYVLANDELVDKQRPNFDTIVCLSVTKWIHLNYRDEGLRRFFKRIYKHLKPSGLLVLEAQPFDNYGRRKKLSDRLKANYYSIQFKPDMFDAYLLSAEVGFKEIVYDQITNHQCAGFRRPLKVFLK